MKKSRLLSLIVSVVVLACCFISPYNVHAEEAVYENGEAQVVAAPESDFTYEIDTEAGTAYIYTYNGSDSKIIIPDTIEGYPVTDMSGVVFQQNEQLEYVKLPSKLSAFIARAFQDCTSLTQIDISDENPYFTVEDGVLYNKDKTTLIAFPTGYSGTFLVPETVVSIANYAFYTCRYLTKVQMYNNVQSIGDRAFSMCQELYSIRFSDNLQLIGDEAFRGCMSLRELHLPYSITFIGTDAFLGDIDSDGNKFYYLHDGIHYVPQTYARNYSRTLHLPREYYIAEPRSVTDPDSNITFYDLNGILPKTGIIEFTATPIPTEEFASLIPIRYADAFGYSLSLKVNGKTPAITKDFILNFGASRVEYLDTATKVYELKDGVATELFRQPHTPFVGAQSKNLGKYIIVCNNDFSLPGDIDGDGVVTTYDTQFALCMSADLVGYVSSEQYATADLDGTEGISTNDALKILRIAAGIE